MTSDLDTTNGTGPDMAETPGGGAGSISGSGAGAATSAGAGGDELSTVLVTLLKGPVFRDRKADLWQHLTGPLQPRVRDQAGILGLDLVIDDAEGYAFLRSDPRLDGDDGQSGPPRLMARRPLTFEVSLLLALLRKRLAEFDGSDGHETRLIMTTDEIADMIRLFLPDTTNETKALDRLGNHINKVIELGFLRRLDRATSGGRASAGQPVRYEVQRIIKAFVDGQWLAEFDQRLAEYRQRLDQSTDRESGSETGAVPSEDGP